MNLCIQELLYWNARNIISQRRFQVLEKGRFWYFEIFLGDLFGVLRGIGRPPFSLSLHRLWQDDPPSPLSWHRLWQKLFSDNDFDHLYICRYCLFGSTGRIEPYVTFLQITPPNELPETASDFWYFQNAFIYFICLCNLYRTTLFGVLRGIGRPPFPYPGTAYGKMTPPVFRLLAPPMAKIIFLIMILVICTLYCLFVSTGRIEAYVIFWQITPPIE